MKEDFLDFVNDALDAMTHAESFVAGMEYDAFSKDTKTIFAVIRALEIVGEAVKRIPENIREQYPQISWKAIAGMRDKLIHGYGNVNLNLVWETTTKKIPKTKPLFQKIIKDYTNQ